MNRNTESHFSLTPTIGISRSKFDRSHTHKGTCNTGEIVPIFCTDILPGDTVKMNMSEIIRMMTPITPVMDNAFADIYFFFEPNRLVYEHWKEEMGENETAPWIQQTEYSTPQIIAPDGGWTKGSLADHFGWPTKVGGYKGDAMVFRGYCDIVNNWFRDENLKNPLYIHKGEADINGVDITSETLDPITDIEKGACCAKAAKVHDYFTSCLPGMQKGPAVHIPLGNQAPVVGADATTQGRTVDTDLIGEPLMLWKAPESGTSRSGLQVVGEYPHVNQDNNSVIGLAVDLSQAVGATVTQLRQAFQIQKFYERAALGGTRYIETIKAHFDTTNPDFRMQRPEYLGGTRIPININQVVQTDATAQRLGGYYDDEDTWIWEMGDQTPQGNTAAYSLTSGKEEDLFTHSFTEHGYLFGLMVIRTVHTYQQGLNRMFSRKGIFDYYWPEFANLSNQSVLNKEIYLQGPSVVDSDGKIIDEQVFGYQECWAEYRYMPDIVTGEMRSNYDQSLDIWHWADYYEALPQLGSDWIDETNKNVARTLAVQNHDQFLYDIYFKCIMTRPMPLYSVPGLIDHH